MNLLRYSLGVALTLLALSLSAQELEIRDVQSKEFPNYSGKLVVRNPSGIDVNNVEFEEGDSTIQATFQEGTPTEIDNKNKSVLLLVLNHSAYPNRTNWYKTVIREATNQGAFSDQDEVAVQSFDCNRDERGREYGDKMQLLFPASPVFKSTADDILADVDEISRKQRLTSNCKAQGDIYGAIYKALEEYGKIKTDLPKSIVVFADDWSIVRQVKEQGIKERSKELDIPIYAITYHQIINRKYGVETICTETYGQYYRDPSNSSSKAASALVEYCGNMAQRAAGYTYAFEFDSPFQKDGKTHGVKVEHNGAIVAFSYESPAMSMIEWAENNPVIALAIGLIVILLIILLFVVRKKNKKAKEAKERAQREEMQRVEAKQQEANLKASQQEQEIKRMKDADRQRMEEERQAKLAKKKEEEDALKLQEMQAKGNLPWFTFEYQGQSGSFEINHPEFQVGREDDNNYRINLPIVSRNHFKIEYKEGKYMLSDMNSSNGTFVNGSKVESCQLKHGDVLSIGDINLTFHI